MWERVRIRLAAPDVVIDKTLTVTRNGVPREITMEEALQHRTYQDAIAGKRLAIREVLKWIEKREAWLAKQTTKTAPGVVMRGISHDPDNANGALQILGIARRDMTHAESDPDRVRLKLEPWAVQAALSRRRGASPLSENDVAEIRRCTRDPDQLRWPRRARG
ncbi:DUF5681 domain-containing protein [Defluviimonas sp. SAOS-178_SWC]|uniref:DUF5681 domain-containing protein n=1 Tax=Defluviimonas sp. SAOS-178_SWC TaxID=3121287 RepID=UPI003221B1A4